MKHFLFFLLPATLFISCKNATTSDHKGAANSTAGTTIEKTAMTESEYLGIGQKIVGKAQAVMVKNLTTAIQKGGPEHALEFCSIKAIPLMDSMAMVLNARLRRVTDKPRNPNNQENEDQLAYIQLLKVNMSNGVMPLPKITEIHGKMVGYYPIITNSLCLQCHGSKPENINAATLQQINEFYPADKATGYKANEVRGLMVVEMDK